MPYSNFLEMMRNSSNEDELDMYFHQIIKEILNSDSISENEAISLILDASNIKKQKTFIKERGFDDLVSELNKCSKLDSDGKNVLLSNETYFMINRKGEVKLVTKWIEEKVGISFLCINYKANYIMTDVLLLFTKNNDLINKDILLSPQFFKEHLNDTIVYDDSLCYIMAAEKILGKRTMYDETYVREVINAFEEFLKNNPLFLKRMFSEDSKRTLKKN